MAKSLISSVESVFEIKQYGETFVVEYTMKLYKKTQAIIINSIQVNRFDYPKLQEFIGRRYASVDQAAEAITFRITDMSGWDII